MRNRHLRLIHRAATLGLALALTCLGALSGGAQAPSAAAPPPKPAVTNTPAAPQPAAAPDPLLTLLQQQPSIDTATPVVIQAEFDPPIARLGGYVLYRMVLNALNDSVKLPEKPPFPKGIEFLEPTRGQALMPIGNKLIPTTTIIYRVNAAAKGLYVMPAYNLEVYGQAVNVPMAQVNYVDPGSGVGREALHLEIEPMVTNFYAGQAIPVRVVLPDPGDASIQGFMQVLLSGDAFLTEPYFARNRRDIVTRNGKPVAAYVSEQTVTSIKAGELTLYAQAHAVMNPAKWNTPGRVQSTQVMLDAKPLILQVKPVPEEGRLPGYTGLIGFFELEPSKLSTNLVRAGDPVALTVTVKGEGNFLRLVPPKAGSARDWQVFSAVVDPNPVYYSSTVARRMFTYTLVPLSPKVVSTPSIPYGYYDPVKQAYVDLTIPPMPIKVLPAPAGVAMPAPQNVPAPVAHEADDNTPQPKEPVMTGLLDGPGTRVADLKPLQQRGWFLLLQAVPAAVLAALWGWHKRRQYLEAHPEVILKQQARRALRSRLRELRQAAANRDTASFVDAATAALREACAPHIPAAAGALVCEDVLAELPEGPDGGGQIVRSLFAAADAWKFSRRKPSDKLLDRLADIEDLLSALRRRL